MHKHQDLGAIKICAVRVAYVGMENSAKYVSAVIFTFFVQVCNGGHQHRALGNSPTSIRVRLQE